MTNEWIVFNQLNVYTKPKVDDDDEDDNGHTRRQLHSNYMLYNADWLFAW